MAKKLFWRSGGTLNWKWNRVWADSGLDARAEELLRMGYSVAIGEKEPEAYNPIGYVGFLKFA